MISGFPVRIVRSINPDTGTQITKDANVAGATAIIHTVTAGKNFYLTFSRCSANIVGSAENRMFVRDAGDAEQYELHYLASGGVDGDFQNEAHSYPYPIEIPAGYDICIVSGAGNSDCHGTLHGWEE
jgi:hypothetical protein